MSINEPGEASTPEDTQADGPVTLSDRTEPGGQGSPGSNQGRTEPTSPTGTHSEPLAVPDLDDMNVGGADPHAPRHPGALQSSTTDTGSCAHEAAGQQPTRLSGDGPERPVQTSTGTAHRAPGIQGQTPEGESVTTDTSAGAARMGPSAPDSTAGESPGQGDDQSVPSSGTAAAEGTSQEHRVVAGIKLPEED